MSGFIMNSVSSNAKDIQPLGNDLQANGKLLMNNLNTSSLNNPPVNLSPLPEYVQNRRKSLLSNNFPSLTENSGWMTTGNQRQENDGVFRISGNLPVRNGPANTGFDTTPNGNTTTAGHPNSPTETEIETINFGNLNEGDRSPLFVRSTLTKRLSSDNLQKSMKTLRRNSTNSLFNVPNSKSPPSGIETICDESNIHFDNRSLDRRNSTRCGRPRFVPDITEDIEQIPTENEQDILKMDTQINGDTDKSREVPSKATSQEKKEGFSAKLLRFGSRSKISTEMDGGDSNKPLPLQVEDLRKEEDPSPMVVFEKSPSTDLLQMQLNEINEGSLEEEELTFEESNSLAIDEETKDDSIIAHEDEDLDLAHWMRLLPDHIKQAPLQHLFIPGTTKSYFSA